MSSFVFRLAAARVCFRPMKSSSCEKDAEISTFSNHVVELQSDTDVSSLMGRGVPFSFHAKLLRHWRLNQESAQTLWWSGTLVISEKTTNELKLQEEETQNGVRYRNCIVSVS